VARDGAEALDCLHLRGGFNTRQAGNPILVLLDLKMPKVNGLEVLQEIKTDPGLQMIPVVMLTSSHEPTDVIRSYELGANAYVVKPVDYQAFRAAIRRVSAFWVATNEPSPGGSPVSSRGSAPVEVAA
jgi:CheY-like chemotaxis protein